MFDREQLDDLRRQVREQAARDARLLDKLLAEARDMTGDVRTIRPRQGTSVALMAADGGNNAVAFNPFELRIIRVMDSAGRQLMLDVVSPAADIGDVSRRHLDQGRPCTALGNLMAVRPPRRASQPQPRIIPPMMPPIAPPPAASCAVCWGRYGASAWARFGRGMDWSQTWPGPVRATR
jgi:hypothetical protein